MDREQEPERSYQAKRERLQKRHAALKSERASWDATNKDILAYLMPGAARFNPGEQNRGEREDLAIIDDTGIDAVLTLASGLQTGVANPAEKWFTLRTEDPDLGKFHSVRKWIDEAVRLGLEAIGRGNTYQTFFSHYEHMGTVGTAAGFMGMAKNPQAVLHHYPMGVGQYCLAEDAEGKVTTCYREFSMTVDQIVRQWGRDNVSDKVRTAYDRHEFENMVQIVHAVEPRLLRDATKQDNRSMPFMSVYYEQGCEEEKVLHEGGFETFPVLAPRWGRRVGDVYGYGPGRRAIGAVKQLQQEQFAKAVALDKAIDPPTQGPSSLKGHEVDRNPGGYTPHDAVGANSGIRTLYEVNVPLQWMLEEIADVRQRIRRAYFTDLFLMLTQAGAANTRMTAEEVRERHAEKLLMLGPLLTGLYDELLRPFVETLMQRMMNLGMLPPAPPELHGVDLGIEFVSPLAMAQKSIGTFNSDRFVAGLQVVAALGKTEVLDRLDADGWTETYHDMTGASPLILVPREKAAEIRAARAKAQQAMAQAQMMEQQANVANKLANAPTDGANAFTDIAAAGSQQ